MEAELRQHGRNNIHSSGSNIEVKAETKRKRPHQDSKQQEDIPWTAARCNRLLRTIKTRINILRRCSGTKCSKKKSIESKSVSNTNGRCGLSDDFLQQKTIATTSIDGFDSPRGNDPEWLPLNYNKTSERTYAGRVKRRRNEVDLKSQRKPIGIDLNTPFIKRMLQPGTNTSPLAITPSRIPNKFPNPHKEGRRNPKKLPLLPKNEADKAASALLEAFSNLLSNTSPPTPPSRSGARSLLSTCLRKMPAYIALEQESVEERHEIEFTLTEISTDIYEHLESFGSREAGGWVGLREAVRAHAVKLVTDALREGVFGGDPLERLVRICAQHDAVAEAQAVLRAWFLGSGGPLGDRVKRLIDCSLELGYMNFLFRTLRDMLEAGVLDNYDLSDYPLIWGQAVKALFRSSGHGDAASFMEAYAIWCIKTSCNFSEAQLVEREKTVRMAVETIAAVIWRSKDSDIWTDWARHIHRIAMASAYARENITADNKDTRHNRAMRSLEPFMITSLVLQIIRTNPGGNLIGISDQELLQLICESRNIIRTGPDFIRDVGRRVLHLNQQEHATALVKNAVSALLQASTDMSSSVSSSIKDLAVASAQAWADLRGDNDSQVFAEYVEDSAYGLHAIQGTIDEADTAKKTVKYRWEEGLCEWIAATPIVHRADVKMADADDSGIGMDCDDSPARIPQQLQPSNKLVHSDREQHSQTDDSDCDELAMITPAIQRQRRVRFGQPVLIDQGTKVLKVAAKRNRPRTYQSDEKFEDVSEDELGFL